jgi:hypothetical protein
MSLSAIKRGGYRTSDLRVSRDFQCVVYPRTGAALDARGMLSVSERIARAAFEVTNEIASGHAAAGKDGDDDARARS